MHWDLMRTWSGSLIFAGWVGLRADAEAALWIFADEISEGAAATSFVSCLAT